MNFYILINSRKVRSQERSKDSCLKIPLINVGTNGEKEYKSQIVVNDIEMDFSINLIQKAMNYLDNNDKSKIKITIKKKAVRNKKRGKSVEKNREIEEKQTSPEGKPKSKLQLFRTSVKSIVIANKIRSSSNENKTKRMSSIYTNPLKVEESHEELEREEDMLNINYPFLEKTSTFKNEGIKEENEEIKEENEESTKLRGLPNNYNPQKRNQTLSQMIMSEKKIPKKLKTINIEEYFLEPIKYDQYLLDNIQKNKKAHLRETFCEGFFISSFPYKDGQVIEKSQSFPAPCNHKECSALPAMKPEIIFRYPLEDTKTLELNNLAATICFPTGIKVCYYEKGPEMIKDYVTPITNQKGVRYYMMTYHFYLKISNQIYAKNYEMHPLKHHLMKFADNYLNMTEDEMDKEVTKKIQTDLKNAENLGFKDYVFVPHCICLISKYPYVKEMKKCLQSIYHLIINKDESLKEPTNKLNYLIMHLINSVPIPDIETNVHFYIPYFSEGIGLKCPKLGDLNIMNSTICDLLKIFSIDNIITIFRFLIFEKKILFVDEDYTRLTNVTDNLTSLLYPFQWMHTYIPIMSDQMLKYLETFLPFLNGIHLSLMPLVKELFQTGEMEESEEMFLIYINENKFQLGSTLVGKKVKLKKYIEENVPEFPENLEKDLKNKLKKIKEEIDNFRKKNPENKDLSEFDLKLRNAFIEMFVKMFHDIDKYLCFLDDDVVFNKNLFLETISKEDKHFYNEFCDTQLFQLFTQNIVNDDLDYFKSMINDYNKNKKFTDDVKNYTKKIYIISPDYLDIKEKKKKNIENKIRQNYDLKGEKDEDGFLLNDKRITEYMQTIDNSNYNNSICNIYLLPKENEQSEEEPKKEAGLGLLSDKLMKRENKDVETSQIKKYARVKTYKNELSEREKDAIKEKIKDFTVKIFKTEEIEEDDHFKKDLQNDINTIFGRDFFVNLLAKNTSNVILLKDKSFNLLGTLIYNTLLYILQVEENNKILEQIVILIKSTMFFGKEEKESLSYFLTSEKKSTVTLWNTYKQKLQGYPKVNQSNLWNTWYEVNLNAEKEKENDAIKKNIILELCDLMIELELVKSFIKNTLEILIKKVFGEEEEKFKPVFQEIVQKIIKTKYISKPKTK